MTGHKFTECSVKKWKKGTASCMEKSKDGVKFHAFPSRCLAGISDSYEI
jgi:hypothetical protein